MNIKILLKIMLEVICAFGLIYVYTTEIQQRHFLYFSNGCYVTVWNAKYLIAGKYYGVIPLKDCAEINTSSTTNLYSDKASSTVFATSLLLNLVPDNKLIVIDKNINNERFEYRIRVDADPIPTFYIESEKQIVAMYPLFINPIISALMSSIVPFFIVILMVVLFNYLTSRFTFFSSTGNKGNNILMVLFESIAIIVILIGFSLGLL